jgi:hypothetical protein
MKANKNIATYRRMRSQPLWRLLASDSGPTVVGLLQQHLYESDRRLPASILYERLSCDLEDLRAQGDDFPQTAQAYVARWLADGFLIRRFPTGASEEEYELTTATVEAIRFLSSIAEPHAVATESRLSLVIQALSGLAVDTDADEQRRVERLLAERDRIDKEIDSIQRGQLQVLPRDSALERTREIISLADDLSGDFRRVRDQFEQLNRELRERIVDSEGHRGEVLDSLFAGIDLISESEAGRSFSAFWRLLTDPEQSATLDESLDGVMSRDFIDGLDIREKRFLLRLTRDLLEQGGAVHEVLQSFARSLKHFVETREYMEQRRINQLLQEAQRAALMVKESVKATETLEYSLDLTSSRIRSVSQWVLYDPSLEVSPEQMRDGEPATINLNSVGELIAQSEIDFRSLKESVHTLLGRREQASIGDVLNHYPASQGLGSVVGLLALGSRHGIKANSVETVTWVGEDDLGRSARIPKIYFLKERRDELS